MNKKEAQEKVDKMNKMIFGFCPEIKDMCRTDCVCHVKGHLTADMDGYCFENPYCKHKNIRGT